MSTIRLFVIQLLLATAILVTSIPAAAQDAVSSEPVFPYLGDDSDMNTTTPPAVESGQTPALQSAAVDDALDLDGFFTEAQIEALERILAKHKPTLDAIAASLTPATQPHTESYANQVYLPSIAGGTTAHASDSVQPVASTLTITDRAQVMQAVTQLDVLQNTISQELEALLTAEQKQQFTQSGLAQKSESLIARSGDDTVVAASTSNCFYAAQYAGLAYHYANLADYYAYYDRIRVGNSYSYNNWYYNNKARSYLAAAAIYAGGAYFQARNGYSLRSWDNSAHARLNSANYYGYWGRTYAWRSRYWANSTYWGYYSYAYANAAYAYTGYAIGQIKYC